MFNFCSVNEIFNKLKCAATDGYMVNVDGTYFSPYEN